VLRVTSFPFQRTFWTGTLPIGIWQDMLGMHEGVVFPEGMMPGDMLAVYGSIADKPGPENEVLLKNIDSVNLHKISGFRQYRFVSKDPEYKHITLHVLGNN